MRPPTTQPPTTQPPTTQPPTTQPPTTMRPPTTQPPTTQPPQKTVKQLLEEKCPSSISETINGIVYIKPTRMENRENYLFSGCNEFSTCNTTIVDPTSKIILDNIPNNGQCGNFILGDYEWNNNTNKWVLRPPPTPPPAPKTPTYVGVPPDLPPGLSCPQVYQPVKCSDNPRIVYNSPCQANFAGWINCPDDTRQLVSLFAN